MKKVVLYDQDRELLIFFLIEDFLRDTTYVTYLNNKDRLNILPGKKIYIDDSNLKSKIKILNRIRCSIYIKKFRNKNKGLLEKIQRAEVKLYGIEFLQIAVRFFFNEDLYVIEEGTANYTSLKLTKNYMKNFLKKLLLKIFFIKERQRNEKIKKYYLTTNLCKRIPQNLESKVEILNLKELWSGKTEEEKKYILDVFNFNPEILKQVTKNTVMLFTQPLSEDGVISEDRKIELYSQILKKYPKNSIILKPHPREKTDYSKYFKNCYVMTEKYPVEILELVEIKIEKAVTIFSTAVFGLGKDIQIDFYGTEIDENLYKVFGSCDSIMKRNAFL